MKPILQIIGILLISKFAFTQAPNIEWQNTIGGYNDDNLTCIRQTNDGGYILGGVSYSGANGDKTETKFGDSDYWIVKLDATGNVVWQNTIGGSSIEVLNAIEQTLDGGYIIAGYSLSPISGDKTESNILGSYDYWIIKLDAAGSIVWQNTIGGNGNDKANCIIQTIDGGYLVGGESSSDISGDKSENSLGGTDYWVIKLDASGNIVWQNTIGGVSYDGLFSIDQTVDGGYILGGYSISEISGDKTEATMLGSYDYWIIKIDISGNIVWQNTIGGTSSDKLKKVILLNDGNYIVGGTSASGISGDKTEVNHSDDYWVIKLDATGNIIWQNTIGGSGSDRLYDMDLSPDGGYILGGSSLSNVGFDKTEACIGPSSMDDYWIVKLNSSGNIIWENTIGGNKEDNLRSIDQSAEGGIIIGGYSLSPIYEDKTEANWNINTTDFWIVKIESDEPLCEIPSGLYSDNITSSSAKVHWTAAPAADSYKVYYRITGGGAWSKKNATSNFKNLPGLIPATTYEWKIKSNCGVETTDFSGIETFTTMPMKEGEFELNDMISIYPNPANDKINIEINNQFNINSSSNISICDISGKNIFQIEIKSSETEIDVSDYAAGIYFVKVIIGGKQFELKLIIK